MISNYFDKEGDCALYITHTGTNTYRVHQILWMYDKYYITYDIRVGTYHECMNFVKGYAHGFKGSTKFLDHHPSKKVIARCTPISVDEARALMIYHV